MKFKLLVLALSVLGASNAFCDVTLQFGLAGQARATGFSNFAGTPTNGMSWGVVVDTTGNGFAASYDAITADGFAKVNNVATDDYFFTSGLTTSSVGTTLAGAEPGGNGAITVIGLTNTASVSGLGVGDKFAIIWFDGAAVQGSHYGLLENTGATAPFTLPADGNTQPYTAFFVGADPARAASLTFGPVTVTPEPSRALLMGLGALGMMVRRRRRA